MNDLKNLSTCKKLNQDSVRSATSQQVPTFLLALHAIGIFQKSTSKT